MWGDKGSFYECIIFYYLHLVLSFALYSSTLSTPPSSTPISHLAHHDARSKQSYDFEVYASGYKAHTRHEHNVMHYVYFFIYLRDKMAMHGEEEFTSHEYSIVRCVSRG